MKKPICTILALASGSLSLVLTVGWFLNRNMSGDWFEETGFFVNVGATFVAVVMGVLAFIRTEPKKLLAVASLLIAMPGMLLCFRILIAIGSFIFHGDT